MGYLKYFNREFLLATDAKHKGKQKYQIAKDWNIIFSQIIMIACFSLFNTNNPTPKVYLSFV